MPKIPIYPYTALKIHISLETKLLLDTFGDFKIAHRGMVDVKGKGVLDTYWLRGKKPVSISEDRNVTEERSERRTFRRTTSTYTGAKTDTSLI